MKVLIFTTHDSPQSLIYITLHYTIYIRDRTSRWIFASLTFLFPLILTLSIGIQQLLQLYVSLTQHSPTLVFLQLSPSLHLSPTTLPFKLCFLSTYFPLLSINSSRILGWQSWPLITGVQGLPESQLRQGARLLSFDADENEDMIIL